MESGELQYKISVSFNYKRERFFPPILSIGFIVEKLNSASLLDYRNLMSYLFISISCCITWICIITSINYMNTCKIDMIY